MDGNISREQVAELVSEATGGQVPVTGVLAGDSLVALGVDSLAMLRLVDAIESTYGVEVEFNRPGHRLDTVDDLVAVLTTAVGSA